MKISISKRITIHIPVDEISDAGYEKFKWTIKKRKDYFDMDCDGDYYNIVLSTANPSKAKQEIKKLIEGLPQ